MMRALRPYSRRITAFAFIVLFVFAVTSCAGEIPKVPEIKKGDRAAVRAYLDKLIGVRMNNRNLEALSIVLVSGNETILARGYGKAMFGRDLKNAKEQKVGADAVYAAASISKLFTSMAVMRLAEQGKLDIDAPVKKILPWYPDEKTTARDLMSHRSGLPANLMNGFSHNGQPPPLTGMVPALSRLRIADRGKAAHPFRYSNLGFSVLGLMIQTITRRPFADYMRNEILLPLGMKNSDFGYRATRNPRLVMGNRGGEHVQAMVIRDLPAGALFTSAVDLGEFMKSLLAPATPRRRISAQTFQRMLKTQNPGEARDAGFEIGLTWFRNSFGMQKGGRKAGHAGDLPPYHGFLMTLPDHGLGVAILCNTEASQASIIYTAMDALRAALQSEQGIAPADVAKAKAVKLDPAKLDSLVGTYATGMSMVPVRRDGDALLAPLFGIPMELEPLSDGSFQPAISVFGLFSFRVADIEPLRVRFPAAKSGHTMAILMSDFLVASGDMVKPGPISGAWKKRIGAYRIKNQSGIPMVNEFRLVEKDGFLLLSAKPFIAKGMRIDLPLKTISDGEARVLGTGEFIRVERGRLGYSGYVLEKKAED